MKRIFTIILLYLFLPSGLISCTPGANPPPDTEIPDENNSNDNDDTYMKEKISIRIGNTYFTALLRDNSTVKAFRALLPLTVTMNEHAGNEKYYNLSEPLPVDAFRPGTIRTGDLMLWGNDCVVLFYETFSTNYSYTPIGKIDDPSELPAVVGSGSVTVTFDNL